MTRNGADDVGRTDSDRRLLDRIASAYAPEPRAPVQRRLFAEALESRLADGGRWWRPTSFPVLAGAAAVALAIVIAIGGTVPSSSSPSATKEDVAELDTRGEILVALALDDSADTLGDEFLPDEYAELADALGL